jgi:hypothetical protein
MANAILPPIDRAPRAEQTRAKSTQRKPWAPPSRLDAPEPPPGYKHRWIRVEAGGIEDRVNVFGKLREGYELVRAEEYPGYQAPSVLDGKHAGVIGVGDVLLARIPEETVAERHSYYNSRADAQLEAADNELMKSNAHSSMRIQNPERRSRVSFGSPGIKDE